MSRSIHNSNWTNLKCNLVWHHTPSKKKKTNKKTKKNTSSEIHTLSEFPNNSRSLTRRGGRICCCWGTGGAGVTRGVVVGSEVVRSRATEKKFFVVKLTLFVHDKDKILKSTVSGLTWPNLDLLDLLQSSLRTVTFTLWLLRLTSM